MREHVAIPLSDPTQVGAARRVAIEMARELGIPENERGEIAIVVTEAASNALRHGEQGELVLAAREGPPPGLEVLALDRGRGMDDLGACMRDGYSTAGTPGAGLGAILRQSALFDVHTVPGAGTVVSARTPRAAGEAGDDVAVLCLPMPGEEACGDAVVVSRAGERTVILVVDALGHGVPAAAVQLAARRRFVELEDGLGPTDVLGELHAALRGTRGAAGLVLELTPGRARYAGVGNIAGAVCSASGRRGLVSHNGTLGGPTPRLQELALPVAAGDLVVLHSDGLQSRWDLGKYPGVFGRRPQTVAGLLYRDFSRGRDDVSVAVVRAT